MDQPINNLNPNNIPPVTTPIQNTEPVVKKSVTPLLIIFFIVLFSCGAFFLGQYLEKNKNSTDNSIITQITTIPTAIPTKNTILEWKTYTNVDYRYSVKYPDTWVRVICPDGELILGLKQGDEDTYQTDNCPSGIFVISSQKEEIIIPKIGLETTSFEVTSVVTAVKSKQILIDNLPAKEYTITHKTDVGPTNYTNIWVIFSYKGRNFKIISGDKNLLDSMLSTFKFLDSSQTDKTAGWKTYIHDKCGSSPNAPKKQFEIKIPTEWKESIADSYKYSLSNDYFFQVSCGGGYGDSCINADGKGKLLKEEFPTLSVQGKVSKGCLIEFPEEKTIYFHLFIEGKSSLEPTFSLMARLPNSIDTEKLIDQILSTFKFL